VACAACDDSTVRRDGRDPLRPKAQAAGRHAPGCRWRDRGAAWGTWAFIDAERGTVVELRVQPETQHGTTHLRSLKYTSQHACTLHYTQQARRAGHPS